MSRITVIELFKENMHFPAGHFTIFSATERECLHGHNFSVYVALTARLGSNGMAFDYDIYKDRIRLLCKEISHTFLLPADSPYLRIEDKQNYYHVHFHDEMIPFLKRDVTILPLRNITVEELAFWFVERLTEKSDQLAEHQIMAVTAKVFSGPGQCGSANWEKDV